MINLSVAEETAALGFRIFPVEPRGKRPLVKNWPNVATTDLSQIRAWWAKWPDANMGMACGKKSGVFVIDVDVNNGKNGNSSLGDLFSRVDYPVPETRESITGSGGRHLFYQYPIDREVRNKQNILPGLDVRGEGGYVVLPPSIHESGRSYAWASTRESIECPDPVLDLISPIELMLPWDMPQQAETTATVVKPPVRIKDTSVLKRASLYLQEVPAAVQGAGGHNALLWAARCLVVGFELSDEDALGLLWSEYNPRCSPPWDYAKLNDMNDF